MLGAAMFLAAAQAAAQVTFYEGEGHRGRAFTTSKAISDFARSGFNDRASSVVVDKGRWEVCEDARFEGRCVVLRPGSYDSLRALGLGHRISSVRPTDKRRRESLEAPAPRTTAKYDWRRRSNERVYEAQVILVRAVMGDAPARCWVERQMVTDSRGEASRGTVLGHQVVAGGVRGAEVAREGNRNVPRCQGAARGKPAYWNVTYSYEGIEHQVQLSEAPGRTIAVNRTGEPRQ